MITPEFTLEEQKVRKTWFRLFLLLNLPFALMFLVGLVTSFFPQNDLNAFSLIFLFSILFLIGPYPIYYCAYKNQGIHWLTVVLVWDILLNAFSIFSFFLFCILNPDLLFKGWTPFGLFIMTPLSIWWTFLGFKLRRINKKYSYLDISDKDCLAMILKIQTAQDLEELETLLYTAVQILPQFGSCFCKAYQKRKKELAAAPLS